MTNTPTDFKIGQVHATEAGLSKLLIHEQSIQVQRLDDGKTCLSLVETGRVSTVFHLTPQQAIEFAVKLLGCAGVAQGHPAVQASEGQGA